MPFSRTTNVLLKSYSAVKRTGLLDNPVGKRAFHSAYFLYKRYFEDPFFILTKRFPALFQGGDLYDVGANIGYTSLLFSKAVDPEAKVFAFEPDEGNFAELQANVLRGARSDRASAERIVPVCAALGDKDGSIDLWHNSNHHADHKVITESFRNRSVPGLISTVRMCTLDAFREAQGIERKVSFVKIDVQGFELAVLGGMRETLNQFPDLSMVVEYCPQDLFTLGYNSSDLFKFFRECDLRLHLVDRSSGVCVASPLLIEKIANARGYADILCHRRRLVK